MKRPHKHSSSGNSKRSPNNFTPSRMRVIAGVLRGRKIEYNGDPATRPMKDRTRESVFSLLGGYLDDTFAVDLFGGTGVLAFEAVSRGASGGVIFELSRTSLSAIITNMQALGLQEHLEVHNIDTLRWFRAIEENTKMWPRIPWVIFCCPPYRMWNSDTERLAEGMQQLFNVAPTGSQFVCETDVDVDLATAIPGINWDIRKYSPAYVGVAKKAESE